MSAATQSTAAPTDDKSQEPQTAAARKAAGLAPLEGQQAGADGAGADGQGDVGADDGDGQGDQGAAQAPAPRSVTSIPGGDQVTPDNITPEELATIALLRSSRGAEIREKLGTAPIGLGTDSDPYVLVHMRGCPEPDKTETYDGERPDGKPVTIQRCMTCGAQIIIDH